MKVIYIKCLWLDDLEDEVNLKMREGYIPFEHLIIDKEGKYIQAMIKH